MTRAAALLAAVALAAALAGCSGEQQPAGHTHADGVAMVSLPVGDGTEASSVGYSLAGLSWSGRAGRAGELSFRIEDADGRPITAFIEELTRDLHLYVVRSDLEVFRHLHPTMAEDGTWTVPVTLPTGGEYRVVTEFVAEDDGGNGDHLVLGDTFTVPGPAGDADEEEPMLEVEVAQAPAAGPDGRMRLVVRDPQGRPVRLGTYLGSYAHVTGLHHESGSVVHTHPLSEPEVTEDGSAMTFHTEVEQAGDYRMFVQVRVDGYLHTVPVEVDVAGSAV